MAVEFTGEEDGFLRVGLGHHGGERVGNLLGLAPFLRLEVRPARVRPRAPRGAGPFAFEKVQAGQRDEQALAAGEVRFLREAREQAVHDGGLVQEAQDAEGGFTQAGRIGAVHGGEASVSGAEGDERAHRGVRDGGVGVGEQGEEGR